MFADGEPTDVLAVGCFSLGVSRLESMPTCPVDVGPPKLRVPTGSKQMAHLQHRNFTWPNVTNVKALVFQGFEE
jgi:hypothetical protein